MVKTYKVELVGPEEWEQLQAEGKACECVKESLGFADAQAGTGYVRATNFDKLNRYLVDHEFEHLTESEATDECPHGLRHKKFFKETLRNVAATSLAPLTMGASLAAATPDYQEKVSNIVPKELVDASGILGAGAGAVVGGPVGGAIGGALGSTFKQAMEQPDPNASLGQRILGNGLKNAALGGALGAGAGALGMPTVAGSAGAGPLFGGSKVATSAQAGRIAGPGSAAGQSQPLASGSTGAPSGGGIGKIKVGMPELFQGSQGATTAGGGGGGSPSFGIPQQLNFGGAPAVPTLPMGGSLTTQQASQQAPNGLARLAGALGMGKGDLARIGIGAAISGAGDLFSKTPEVPDLNQLPSVAAIRQNAQAGGANTPLGQLGQQQLTNRLSQPFQGLSPDVEASIKNTFQRERDRLISQFKAIRPNADLTTDSAFRQAMFELDRQEADQIAQSRQQEFARFQTERGQDIQTALGVDQQTLETFTQLAQLDVDQIAKQLEIDLQSAQQFKQTWGNIGAAVASGSFGGGSP